MRTAPVKDVHHAVCSMRLAVCRRLGALVIEARLCLGGIMSGNPATDDHHAVSSMLSAVRSRMATLSIEDWPPSAGVV